MAKPMRFVVTRREAVDLADGISNFIYSLSDALMRLGDEVFLVTPSQSSEESIRERFGSLAFTALHNLCASSDPTHLEMITAWVQRGVPLLRKLKPDFIIVNGGLPMRLPYPTCIISHDLERRGPYGSLIRQLYKMYSYRKVDHIVATCTELRDALAREIFIRPDEISVIPTCIDITAYRNKPLEAREAAILHVGTTDWKNPTATIDAFVRLHQPATLYVVGNVSPELKQRLALLPEEINSRISLLGIVDSNCLKELLSKVRVLSVPSIYTLPVASPTVLDGLASGTPVIGSSSISADLLTDGITGFRVDPRQTIELANKLELLLGNDGLWQTMSANCRRVSENFSNDSVAQKFRNLATSTSSIS